MAALKLRRVTAMRLFNTQPTRVLPPSIWKSLALLSLLTCCALTGCTFDRSGLVNKGGCVEDDHCPSGQVCENGRCILELDRGGDIGDAGTVDGVDFGNIDGSNDDTDDMRVDPGDSGLDPDDPPLDSADVGIDTGEDAGCPDPNTCGGCEPLGHEPGTECGTGECGTGEWACATEDVVECQSEDVPLNACGGCDELDDDPGDECGDCGVYICGDDGESLDCDDPGRNLCGGCDELEHDPEDLCGACLDGEWTCDGEGGLDCRDATPANACGGCGLLAAAPLSACGACLDGTHQCNPAGTAVSCVDATPANVCGGCGVIIDELGAVCGDCGGDTWQCTDDKTALECPTGIPFNACGTCAVLAHPVGTECGVCSDGEWTCNGDGSAVYCKDATPANSCGGCGTLEAEPLSDCGDCGFWTCNIDNSAVECLNDPGYNLCGGCGELADDPDTACGLCDLGTWACTAGLDAVECEGEQGYDACGGCAMPRGAIGTACSCSGLGDATYYCSDTSLLCADTNSTPGGATWLDPVAESESRTKWGWIDSWADDDWYAVNATDVGGTWLQPTVTLTTVESEGIDFRVCVFFRYTNERRITPYSCDSGDQCVWYDNDQGTIKSGNCSRQDGFARYQDLYGCCETDRSDDGSWKARLEDVDGVFTADGTVYPYIEPTSNTRPEGCAQYKFVVSF